MSTMPYTLQSFVELAERDSRRGRDLSSIHSGVANAIQALKDHRGRYWANVRRLPADDQKRQELRRSYIEKRQELREKRDLELEKSMQLALDVFQKSLSGGTHKWGLSEGKEIDGRQTYKISNALAVQFPAKQAAAVLRRESGAATKSRNSIIRALKNALQKNYLHAVYRVDVKSFFDSIPHEILQRLLRKARGIDSITFELIDLLLYEFELLRGQPIGIPPGIGLSSQLAEFYLSDLDRTMRSFPGVLFYARYVDDIILVIENESSHVQVKAEVQEQLKVINLGLNDSADKNVDIVTQENGDYYKGQQVTYLGYTFKRTNEKLITSLTQRRVTRRRRRLEIAFDKWRAKNPSQIDPNPGDDGLLVERIRFLTANTTLQNSKDNAAVGLYFSNSALDKDSHQLQAMDQYLKHLIDTNKQQMSNGLQTKLRAISFKSSFEQQTFIRYRRKKLEQIVSCWQEAR